MKLGGTLLLAAIAMGLPLACGGDDSAPPNEQTGSACTSAAQCFPNTNDAALQGGPAVCLTRVPDGYCTHVCAQDTDCCAVPGECRSGFPQVCSPFESTNDKYCFLSCEDVPKDAGVADADAYCGAYAHVGFKCRSSGGGSQNRKVCVPN